MIESILYVTLTAFFVMSGLSGIYISVNIYRAYVGRGWFRITAVAIMGVMSIACLLFAAGLAGLLS